MYEPPPSLQWLSFRAALEQPTLGGPNQGLPAARTTHNNGSWPAQHCMSNMSLCTPFLLTFLFTLPLGASLKVSSACLFGPLLCLLPAEETNHYECHKVSLIQCGGVWSSFLWSSFEWGWNIQDHGHIMADTIAMMQLCSSGGGRS